MFGVESASFHVRGLAGAPALQVVEAESTTPELPNPDEVTFVRRLRAWLITPLTHVLARAPLHQVVSEAIEAWRIASPVWRDYQPTLRQLLIERGALPVTAEGVVAAVEQEAANPWEALPNLPPRARVYLDGYHRVLRYLMSQGRGQMIEGVVLFYEEPELMLHGPGDELQTFFALCHAVAVAGLERAIPAATVETLATALWDTYRRLLQPYVPDEVFDTALEEARSSIGEQSYGGPAISRWKRRRGGGPRGIRLTADFNDPLPEFDEY